MARGKLAIKLPDAEGRFVNVRERSPWTFKKSSPVEGQFNRQFIDYSHVISFILSWTTKGLDHCCLVRRGNGTWAREIDAPRELLHSKQTNWEYDPLSRATRLPWMTWTIICWVSSCTGIPSPMIVVNWVWIIMNNPRVYEIPVQSIRTKVRINHRPTLIQKGVHQ
jgi:hypothetical protein